MPYPLFFLYIYYNVKTSTECTFYLYESLDALYVARALILCILLYILDYLYESSQAHITIFFLFVIFAPYVPQLGV